MNLSMFIINLFIKPIDYIINTTNIYTKIIDDFIIIDQTEFQDLKEELKQKPRKGLIIADDDDDDGHINEKIISSNTYKQKQKYKK